MSAWQTWRGGPETVKTLVVDKMNCLPKDRADGAEKGSVDLSKGRTGCLLEIAKNHSRDLRWERQEGDACAWYQSGIMDGAKWIV